MKPTTFITESCELWDKPSRWITTASDTEYEQIPNHPNLMITTQLASSANADDCIVLEHPDLNLGILPSWNTKCILSSILGYEEDYDEDTEPDAYLVWEVLLFFAPADLLAGLFSDRVLCERIQRYLEQNGRITINTEERKHRQYLKLPVFVTDEDKTRYQIVLKTTDLAKLGAGGLKKIASSLGVKMTDKNKMDDYKKEMLTAYKNPVLLGDFIKYAKSDATVLFELREASLARTAMLYETIGLEPPEREKLTTGSLVAGLFYDWLVSLFENHENYHGSDVLPGYKYFRSKNGKTPYALQDLLKKCGVEYFATSNPEYSKQANSLVQGGRAKNERPTVISDSGVIPDADLTSCYATILENLVYPVGFPFVHQKHESDKRITTLGDFLKKHEKSLVPRLYTIVVSGKLNHHQTLVNSKLVDSYEITEKYCEDNPKIPADFRLYTNEVHNGVITSDILEALRTVCNKTEWASWMKLEVITALWYPDYKEIPDADVDTWSYLIKTYDETGENFVDFQQKNDGTKFVIDKRSTDWVGIPIKDFIKPFKDKRKALKDKRNAIADKTAPEWLDLDAQQDAMKLVCNTLYGVLASPYFCISNVVLANNITAAARTAVWMLSCATGSYQSITDGGAYNLNQVRDWRGDKIPSMNTLSLWRNPDKIQRRYTSKLFTKPLASDTLWTISASERGLGYSVVKNEEGAFYEAKEEQWSYFDEQLLMHIKHFFRGAETLPSILNIISFTHKDIYESIVLHSQTNYALTRADGYIKPKARGHKLEGTPYDNETNASNIKDLFERLATTPDRIPAYSPQTITQILKCNQANELLLAKTPNIVQENGLLAGDTIIEEKHLRPISLSMFHWKTHEQWLSWSKKAQKLKDKHGYGIEQSFLFPNGDVKYQIAVNTIQERIDAGWMWIVDEKSRGHQSRLKPQMHPALKVKANEEDLGTKP